MMIVINNTRAMVRVAVVIIFSVLMPSSWAQSNSLELFEGTWAGNSGEDSLVVFLNKVSRSQIDIPQDTFPFVVEGTYNLFRSGELITGNHDKNSIVFGVLRQNGSLHSFVHDRGVGDHSLRYHLSFKIRGDSEILWELGYPEEVFRVRSDNDPPFPKPIPGFKLPDNIVLTRLKD